MINGKEYTDYLGIADEAQNFFGDAVNTQNWAIPGDTIDDTLKLVKEDYTTEEFRNLQDEKFEFYNKKTGREDNPKSRNQRIEDNTSMNELIEQAEVIAISIGGNDLLHRLYDVFEGDYSLLERVQKIRDLKKVTQEHIETKLPELIDSIEGLNGDVEIYINLIFNEFPWIPYSKVLNNNYSKGVNSSLTKVANEYPNMYTFGPAYAADSDLEKYWGNDKFDVHPTKAGYEMMFGYFLNSFIENSSYIDSVYY
jgi:hypothetical protein